MNWLVVYCVVGVLFGSCCSAVDLEVDMIGLPGSGFFMKPFYPVHNDSSVQEWPFVMLPGLQSITASYGPFAAQADVSQPDIQSAFGSQNAPRATVVVDSYIISAHVGWNTISLDQPHLRVIFHAGRPMVSSDTSKGSSGRSRYRVEHGFPRLTQICAVMYVQRGEEELITSCTIDGTTSDSVCVADLTAPYHWLLVTRNASVDIFFSAFAVGRERRCAAMAETVDGKNQQAGGRFADGLRAKRVFAGSVNVVNDLSNYGELREDQHLLIYVPTVTTGPGSLFYVPVKLQSESDLQLFVIRVKCRHGIRVLGAEASGSSAWHISTDINQKQTGVIVTASVRNDTTYAKKDRVQELFGWLFEVDSSVTDGEKGRLTFMLEYEMTNNRKEVLSPVRNKAVALVHFRSDVVHNIVPVVKTAELVNTAVLTGTALSWPLRIYLLNHIGQAADITLQSSCYSQNEHVLQASGKCDVVYFDGSETRGSSSIDVVVKYSQLSRSISFRVWFPELPLDIDLSDSMLSMINDWRMPLPPTTASRSRNYRHATDASTKLDTGDKEDRLSSCPNLRFQSAVAEVYARFILSDTQPKTYLLHRKALFHVTHLVRSQLRIADASIARLRDGNIIDGLRPGKTEIQVMLSTGRVIAASLVNVAGDRVNVARLDVNVVSALSSTTGTKTDFPGALTFRVTKTKQLHHRYQEAMLDLMLRFDDGTSLPLSFIPDNDYSLFTETLNNHVVTLAPPHLARMITIMAVSPGMGELVRVSLSSSDDCTISKPRPISDGFAFVDVEFDEFAQSDASYYHHRAELDPMDSGRDSKSDKGAFVVSLDGDSLYADDRSLRNGRKRNGKGKFGTIGTPTLNPSTAAEPVVEALPRNEAQKQLVIEAPRGTSSLEMAMYVLLAVFSVSVVIFAANCLLFVTRYRRKRKLTDTKEPVSEVRDWVWIGRATLERNDVDIKCGRRLMSDADFNSNLCRRPPSGSLLLPPGGSNRNSTVSTYRGSECSVRITANPLADDNGNILDEGQPHPPAPRREGVLNPEAYTVEKKEVNNEQPDEAASAKVHGAAARANPVPSSRIRPSSSAWSTMSREEQLRELEDAMANGSGAEWDYEAFGMTYHELMDYFDNLKESTA